MFGRYRTFFFRRKTSWVTSSENSRSFKPENLESFFSVDHCLKDATSMLRQWKFFEVNCGRWKKDCFGGVRIPNGWTSPQNYTWQRGTIEGNYGTEHEFFLSPFPQPIRTLPPRKRLHISEAHKHLLRKRGVYREKREVGGCRENASATTLYGPVQCKIWKSHSARSMTQRANLPVRSFFFTATLLLSCRCRPFLYGPNYGKPL
jgi:hypothetical protein